MASNIKNFGKIRYIEPNDILADKTYNKSASMGTFNIPHPYEDYSISVDLIVTNSERLKCGNIENNTTKVYSDNLNNNKISFFNYNKDYLTDNPNSIVYEDILNNKKTQENLGITDIHISYNSYFYPIVTIKFTDIRGGALMMPHEETYRREQNEITDKVSNFFAALFTFPYPEFTLRVKGFYGKKVDFSLVVEDFKSNFNNQTGNFDATVKFIGKMYGLYTDIPMSYLLIAPYCRYGYGSNNNNQTVWEELDFRFDGSDEGIKIPTFIELQEIIATSESLINTKLDSELISKAGNLSNKKILLDEIKNKKDNLLSFLSRKKNENNNKNNFYIVISNNEKYTKIYISENYIKDEKFLKDLNNIIKELCDSITKINKESGIKISYPSPFNENYKNININAYCEGQTVKVNEEEIEIKCFLIDLEMLEKTIDSLTNYVIRLTNDTNKEIENNYNLQIKELLGFTPSIRNIFMILMAHLHCFIKIYKNFLDNIKDDENRKINKINGLNLKNTDINLKNNNIDNVILPAFPSFIDNRNNFVYPNFNIEEKNLINALLDGTFTFLKEKHEVDLLKEELNDNTLSFIPTCLTDLINFINPYDNILNLRNDGKSNDIEVLFTFFGMRCISKFIFEQNDNLSTEEFGKLEAYNFWRTNQSIGHKLYNLIENTDFNSDNFLSYLSGDKENTYLTSKPYYSDSNVEKLINYVKGNDYISIPNNFNFPAIIGRISDYDFISTFKNDYKIDNCSVSFKYSENENITKNNRPNEFIDFIELRKLNKINSELNVLDISEYCKEENKKKIVECYLTNTLNDKNVIYNSNIYYSSNNSYSIEGLGYNRTYLNNIKDFNKNYINYREAFSQNFKQNSDNNEKILKLSSIQNKGENNKPIFCIDDDKLTPEEFLSSVEHNIFNIVDIIKEGKTVLTIPYITKLFIGMLITKLKEGRDSLDFIIKKNQIELYNENTYNSQGQMSKDGGTKYRKYIYYLLNIFMRPNDGTYNEECFNEDITDTATDVLFYENNSTSIKKYFQNDIYELSKEYKEWSENIFKNLKHEYKFDYNNIKITFKDKIDLKITKDNTKENIQATINNSIGEGFCDKYSAIICDKKLENIYLIFNQEYESYKELEKLFNDVCKFVVPYQMKPYELKNGNISIDKSKFNTSFNSFKNELLKLYKNINSETGEEENTDYINYTSYNVSVDNKLSMYKTLKNLEDKHFYNLKNNEYFEKFKLKKTEDKNIETEFDRFHFIDSFYNDIGDKIKFNLNEIDSILENIIENNQNKVEGITASEISIYSFMSLLCEKHNLMLMSMPVFNGNFTGKNGANNFEHMFTPFSYNNSINENSMSGPSYICFYPHQPSQYLDNPNSQYRNDGFNIIEDINGTKNFEGNIGIPDLEEVDKYVIPAFSVEYGSQKQSIFKNINVNMDNPQTTEVSVAIQFDIANKNNETPQKTRFQGQDLYKIYSNYSYTCVVEMMGCAQIQPLMYFQLNNIPMFRGAYMIISVEHNITPGNMTTIFKGVRINKNKIPIVNSCISIGRIIDNIIEDNNNKISNKKIETHMDILKLYENKSRVNFMGVIDKNISLDDIIKEYYPEHFQYNKEQEVWFNLLNPQLRLLLYNILGDVKELSKSLNYKLGIKLTSSTRVDGENKKSDHYIGDDGTPSEKRKQLEGYNAYGEKKYYDKLGCAVDIIGTKNGVTDKKEASITLFKLIAENYQEYIRQLIWEVNDDNSSPKDNKISNVIHLSSYGKDNDKRMIFMALKSTGYNIYKNKTNISNEYLKILKEVLNNKIEKDISIYPNFSKEEIDKYIV